MIAFRRFAAGAIVSIAILAAAGAFAALSASSALAAPKDAPKDVPKNAPNAAADEQDQPDPEDLKLGEQLLTRDCASCHAVGRTGVSPHKGAPAFRTLGQRYPIESLEEALGEGIMSGHPDMPEFNFDADQVGAIIDYLKSIQTR
ncbi:MAG: c-type cytochrome [Rhodopseudomonas sp.]|nr:c-type cytochrome [Rhodopseudomonas sp.]